jgi:hypothetical protein
MAQDKSSAEPELKVVDRRSQRSETNTQQAAPKVPTEQKGNEGLGSEDGEPINFPSFIVGLATQAMMLLGEIPEPQSGQMLPPNLSAARQTIDVISLLQQKTSGNLTEDESKLMQDVLTSLRLAYVKKAGNK